MTKRDECPLMSASTLYAWMLLTSASIALLWPIVACLGGCFVDHQALYPPTSAHGHLNLFDTRLNSWILAWVQHAILNSGESLFDANIFYPAANTLAGSEHMIGVAVPLLPLRLIGASAVALHQSVIVLSSILAGITTFTLVRWATRNWCLSLVAGLCAIGMPWHFREFSHIQLLNAQWFPLIWLLCAQQFEADRPKYGLLALSFVLTLQALSSFYLGYFVFFSIGVLLPVFVVVSGLPRPKTILALILAVVVPALCVAVTAIPYLNVDAQGVLQPTVPAANAPGFIFAFTTLFGSGSQPPGLEVPAGYISYALIPFALLALVSFRSGEGSVEDLFLPRKRMIGLGLWFLVILTYVMMAGSYVRVGDSTILLPYGWASRLIPGFSHLRGATRWGIIAAMAMPVLAALGASEMWNYIRGRFPDRKQLTARLAVAGMFALAVVATGHWAWPPMKAALADPPMNAYAKLAALPRAATVELPWPLPPSGNLRTDSRYTLGSTYHWQPLLNGYTGYAPPSYYFLVETARGLPQPSSLSLLSKLSGLRWLLLHKKEISPARMEAWDEAAKNGSLKVVFEDSTAILYENLLRQESEEWLPLLRDPSPRTTTFAGNSRAPLDMSRVSGRIEVDMPRTFRYAFGFALRGEVKVRLSNLGSETWPAFDVQDEGLVKLRFRFVPRGEKRIVHRVLSRFGADVSPGASLSDSVLIRPPAKPGAYRVTVDLVQLQNGQLVPLPIEPINVSISVVG